MTKRPMRKSDAVEDVRGQLSGLSDKINDFKNYAQSKLTTDGQIADIEYSCEQMQIQVDRISRLVLDKAQVSKNRKMKKGTMFGVDMGPFLERNGIYYEFLVDGQGVEDSLEWVENNTTEDDYDKYLFDCKENTQIWIDEAENNDNYGYDTKEEFVEAITASPGKFFKDYDIWEYRDAFDAYISDIHSDLQQELKAKGVAEYKGHRITISEINKSKGGRMKKERYSRMKKSDLMPDDVYERIKASHKRTGGFDSPVLAHYYTYDGWDWYVVAGSGKRENMYLYGFVCGMFNEWGSFMLNDLEMCGAVLDTNHADMTVREFVKLNGHKEGGSDYMASTKKSVEKPFSQMVDEQRKKNRVARN